MKLKPFVIKLDIRPSNDFYYFDITLHVCWVDFASNSKTAKSRASFHPYERIEFSTQNNVNIDSSRFHFVWALRLFAVERPFMPFFFISPLAPILQSVAHEGWGWGWGWRNTSRPPGIVQFGIEGKWSIHSGALQRIGILPLNNLKIYDIQFAFLCLNNHELAQYP